MPHCRGTGKLLVNEAALDRLQALRERLGKPFIVRSAYRSPEHNRAVGGAKRSKHMEGTAFDIAMSNHDPAVRGGGARGRLPRLRLLSALRLYAHRPGGEAGVGRALAPRPAFAPEAPPARERLAESRTIKGGGVAGAAMISAAGVEVPQEALAETQFALLPLSAYLDALRWVRRHPDHDQQLRLHDAAGARHGAAFGLDHRSLSFWGWV